MTREELLAACLAKPGAWPDEPWDGDVVAKVGPKIFAFTGEDAVGLKLGRGRDEADEWLHRYPQDASVMAYIGRYGWNALRLMGPSLTTNSSRRSTRPTRLLSRRCRVSNAPTLGRVLVDIPNGRCFVDVTPLVWWVTIGAATVALLLDVAVVARRPRCAVDAPSARPTWSSMSRWRCCSGCSSGGTFGGQYAGEFYAGWLTEYSLSVDNLFVFLLIMANFRVPERLQQSALMVGIIIAIVLRGLFIALGVSVINSYAWVFYIFGAPFLIWTAWKLAREGESDDDEYEENAFLQFVERRFPATSSFHGTKLFVHEGAKRLVTLMFIVIMALGTTDLLFALDSIPAIYRC